MNCRLKRMRGDGIHPEAGVALTEFALVIPVLLLIIFGTFDLGWGVFANNTIAHGAREGARKGIISTASDSDIRQAVKNVSAGLNLQDSDILINRHSESGDDFITVTVHYNFVPKTPLISRFIPGGSLTLTGKATMYVE